MPTFYCCITEWGRPSQVLMRLLNLCIIIGNQFRLKPECSLPIKALSTHSPNVLVGRAAPLLKASDPALQQKQEPLHQERWQGWF